jgi:CPA1 family monovalent cation:H+ antiporter
LCSSQRFTHPGVIDPLREEYERRAEGEVAEVQRLGEDRDRMNEERRRARRQLLLVERQSVVDAYHRGEVGVRTYERLLADIDARLATSEEEEGDLPEREAEGKPETGS